MYTRCSADDTHVAPLVVFTSVYTWGHSGAHFFPTSQLLRYTQTGVALRPESASPSDMAWNAADFGVSLRRQLSDGATAAVETWRHQPARENAAHLLKYSRWCKRPSRKRSHLPISNLGAEDRLAKAPFADDLVHPIPIHPSTPPCVSCARYVQHRMGSHQPGQIELTAKSHSSHVPSLRPDILLLSGAVLTFIQRLIPHAVTPSLIAILALRVRPQGARRFPDHPCRLSAGPLIKKMCPEQGDPPYIESSGLS